MNITLKFLIGILGLLNSNKKNNNVISIDISLKNIYNIIVTIYLLTECLPLVYHYVLVTYETVLLCVNDLLVFIIAEKLLLFAIFAFLLSYFFISIIDKNPILFNRYPLVSRIVYYGYKIILLFCTIYIVFHIGNFILRYLVNTGGDNVPGGSNQGSSSNTSGPGGSGGPSGSGGTNSYHPDSKKRRRSTTSEESQGNPTRVRVNSPTPEYSDDIPTPTFGPEFNYGYFGQVLKCAKNEFVQRRILDGEPTRNVQLKDLNITPGKTPVLWGAICKLAQEYDGTDEAVLSFCKKIRTKANDYTVWSEYSNHPSNINNRILDAIRNHQPAINR